MGLEDEELGFGRILIAECSIVIAKNSCTITLQEKAFIIDNGPVFTYGFCRVVTRDVVSCHIAEEGIFEFKKKMQLKAATRAPMQGPP